MLASRVNTRRTKNLVFPKDHDSAPLRGQTAFVNQPESKHNPSLAALVVVLEQMLCTRLIARCSYRPAEYHDTSQLRKPWPIFRSGLCQTAHQDAAGILLTLSAL